MEELGGLALIAVFILWIRLVVISDRVKGLRYRIQQLEKQLQERAQIQTADAPAPGKAPAEESVQPAPAETSEPEPVVSAKETAPANATAPEQTEPARPEIPVLAAKVSQPADEKPLPAAEPSGQTSAEQPHTAEPAPRQTGGADFSPAKLFSWIGGLLLFLGCVFGIKYAVENNLLSPAARIICSTGLGIILAAAGYCIRSEKYRITAHTLLGSGLAVIYASVYCAHAFYQFIPPGITFALLALTALAAFGAAMRKNAKYVGYLGAVIAFLTPLLVNSGNDAWIALFTYILLINAAAALAAAKRGWNGLLICTLAFTWLSQAVWLFAPYPVEAYKLNGVCIFFSLYAFGAAWLAHRHSLKEPADTALGVFLCAGLVLTLPLAGFVEYSAANSVKLLGYALFTNLLVLWQAGRGHIPAPFASVGKIIAFLTLFIWSNAHFNDISPVLLFGSFIVFAAVNGGAEFVWRGDPNAPRKLSGFSALYPALLMLPVCCMWCFHSEISFGTTVMMIGLLFILMSGAVSAAYAAGNVWAAATGMGLMLLTLWALTGYSGKWSAGELSSLIWLGFIPAVLGSGIFAFAKKLKKADEPLPNENILFSLTALAPFILVLTLVTQHSHERIFCPHWILGATLALCALNALAARIYKEAQFLPAALAGAALVQLSYGYNQLTQANVAAYAYWAAGIFALFFVLPFAFKKLFWKNTFVWAAAALAGVVECGLIYFALKTHAESFHWGLLPAAFLLVYLPAAIKLYTENMREKDNAAPLAFMAGAALCFLTAVFPLETSGKWLTLAWTLEGFALIWLNKRIPYKGLTGTGYGLLAISAVRLLFPETAPVPAARIWNWYLGIYGAYAACAFLAARLWPKESRPFCKKSLAALGGVMLFWLLNIEIAHWFADGKLSFAFTGSLAEALTYTLAWALFGGACIGLGLFYGKPAASKAGAGIIILALIKFFLSDIWELEALYRIIGLFGLAVILIAASFYYQRAKKTSD